MEDKENIIALQSPAQDLRVRLCLFTSYLITFVFDHASKRAEGRNLATHPDSYTRLHNLIRTTASHLIDAHPATPQIFRQVVRDLKGLRRAVPTLVDPERLLDDCAAPKFQAALDEKDRQLESARSHFAPFGFA